MDKSSPENRRGWTEIPQNHSPCRCGPVMMVDRESMATTAAPAKQTEEMA